MKQIAAEDGLNSNDKSLLAFSTFNIGIKNKQASLEIYSVPLIISLFFVAAN